MKIILPILFLFSLKCIADTDAKLCLEYVNKDENYKYAHKNKNCIAAAENLNGPALYAVGMGYGFEGQKTQEHNYYILSASMNTPSAYLALGHIYRDKDEDKAIYWYEKYANTDQDEHKLGAYLLAQIYKKRNNTKKYNFWLSACKESTLEVECTK